MGAAEFAEWRAYLEVEPAGDLRGDLHTAMLMTLLANVNRDRKKKAKPFVLADFLPDFWKMAGDEGHPDAAAILAKFKMLTG